MQSVEYKRSTGSLVGGSIVLAVGVAMIAIARQQALDAALGGYTDSESPGTTLTILGVLVLAAGLAYVIAGIRQLSINVDLAAAVAADVLRRAEAVEAARDDSPEASTGEDSEERVREP